MTDEQPMTLEAAAEGYCPWASPEDLRRWAESGRLVAGSRRVILRLTDAGRVSLRELSEFFRDCSRLGGYLLLLT